MDMDRLASLKRRCQMARRGRCKRNSGPNFADIARGSDVGDLVGARCVFGEKLQIFAQTGRCLRNGRLTMPPGQTLAGKVFSRASSARSSASPNTQPFLVGERCETGDCFRRRLDVELNVAAGPPPALDRGLNFLRLRSRPARKIVGLRHFANHRRLNLRLFRRRGLEFGEVEIPGKRINTVRIGHHATCLTVALLPLRSRSTSSAANSCAFLKAASSGADFNLKTCSKRLLGLPVVTPLKHRSLKSLGLGAPCLRPESLSPTRVKMGPNSRQTCASGSSAKPCPFGRTSSRLRAGVTGGARSRRRSSQSAAAFRSRRHTECVGKFSGAPRDQVGPPGGQDGVPHQGARPCRSCQNAWLGHIYDLDLPSSRDGHSVAFGIEKPFFQRVEFRRPLHKVSCRLRGHHGHALRAGSDPARRGSKPSCVRCVV
jgi:hypothetical protein